MQTYGLRWRPSLEHQDKIKGPSMGFPPDSVGASSIIVKPVLGALFHP